MTYYRLEYNEKQGLFHFEDNKSHPENINGWLTIAKGIPESRCENFVERMERKYKGITDERYEAPDFKTVFKEFHGIPLKENIYNKQK